MATTWEIPGRAEALARENQLREESYLGAPQLIAGVKCAQITPRSLTLLSVIGSPFVCGGAVTKDAALQFLWTLAIDLRDGMRNERYKVRWIRAYEKHVARRGWDWEYVVDAISDFVEETFMDAPTGGSDSTPYVCSSAWLEIRMRKIMGWSYETTRDVPLRRIYQLLRCDAMEQGDRTLVNKLSDKANDDWMKAVMQNPEAIAEIQKGGITIG